MLSMPFKNPSQRLRDIVDNIDAIEMFTTGMELEASRRIEKPFMLSSARWRLCRKPRPAPVPWNAVPGSPGTSQIRA